MYEPVSEGSYIKMIDMVSGGGKMEVSSQFKPKDFLFLWSGHISSSVVSYLL